MNINKPIVKQYVADWYEDNKEDFEKNLFEFIYYVVSYYIKNEPKSLEDFESLFEEWKRDDFKRWMSQAYENGAITTLVNMHQFGYEIEVEKEKLYTVQIPNPNGDSNRYGLCKVDGRIVIGSFVFGFNKATNTKLTEAEIKKDFEWAFQFAKSVEDE